MLPYNALRWNRVLRPTEGDKQTTGLEAHDSWPDEESPTGVRIKSVENQDHRAGEVPTDGINCGDLMKGISYVISKGCSIINFGRNKNR